jgi:peptidoglycan/xylan/chitin deacetylase (PgdA/CDA1 family)
MPPKQADRWRWHLKVALASVIARASRVQQHAMRAREQRRPLILGYHRVVEDFAEVARTEMPSMLISRTMFERHIDWIGRSFRFVTLDEIGEHLLSGAPFMEPVAAVTFDDGYSDVYEHALPVLRRKGIPAAMFVVTNLVGQPSWQVHDKLYYLIAKAFAAWDDPRRRLFDVLSGLQISPACVFRSRAALNSSMSATATMLPALSQAEVARVMHALETLVGNGATHIPQSLTWPMIHEMRRSGFTIGSHTRRHASLPMEPPDVVLDELEGSKRALEEQLGERVDHFAYPGGAFTPAVVEALSHAGYRFAYTACPHREPKHPLLTIERLLLWEGSSIDADGRFSSAVLNCQVHDLWPPARRCERLHHA